MTLNNLMRSLIVTCGDENYATHAKIMLDSIYHQRPDAEVGMLDLGLTTSRSWFTDRGVKLVVPEWDFAVSEELRQSKPHLKALTARPYLPKYFPGYDVLLHIEADTWVQDVTALDDYITTASGSSIAITLESHQSYRLQLGKCAYNAGIFAIKSDSTVWNQWAEAFKKFLPGMNRGGWWGIDQDSINFLIRSGSVSFTCMSPLHNWVCHKAMPIWKKGKWVEPSHPFRDIKIIHCTLGTKQFHLQLLRDEFHLST